MAAGLSPAGMALRLAISPERPCERVIAVACPVAQEAPLERWLAAFTRLERAGGVRVETVREAEPARLDVILAGSLPRRRGRVADGLPLATAGAWLVAPWRVRERLDDLARRSLLAGCSLTYVAHIAPAEPDRETLRAARRNLLPARARAWSACRPVRRSAVAGRPVRALAHGARRVSGRRGRRGSLAVAGRRRARLATAHARRSLAGSARAQGGERGRGRGARDRPAYRAPLRSRGGLLACRADRALRRARGVRRASQLDLAGAAAGGASRPGEGLPLSASGLATGPTPSSATRGATRPAWRRSSTDWRRAASASGTTPAFPAAPSGTRTSKSGSTDAALSFSSSAQPRPHRATSGGRSSTPTQGASRCCRSFSSRPGSAKAWACCFPQSRCSTPASRIWSSEWGRRSYAPRLLPAR